MKKQKSIRKNSFSKESSLHSKLHPEAVKSKDLTASGITLIALVITVIILLILASVALSLIAGENGIWGKAENAADNYKDSAIIEDIEILVAQKAMDYYAKENREASLGENLVNNSPEEGYEGRDNARIFFESIEDGIVHITYIDKNSNETYLIMNLDGSNIRIVGRGNSDEIMDVIAPTLQIITTTTNSITFQSTDRVGVVAYQITENNDEPNEWNMIDSIKKTEQTISNLENNKTYYIWVKDKAGNVRSKEAVTADFQVFSYEVKWEGTTAIIEVTTPQSGVQFKIGKNGTWADYSETSKASTPSGTEVFFQATDGRNIKGYSSVLPLWSGSITYDANGGTGEVPSVQSAEHTRTVEIDFTKKPTKGGCVFLGWAKNSEAKTPDYSENGTKQFTMGTENIILYAVWQDPITADSVSKNPQEYFGKTVNYTPPNNATKAWQVFYADTENIYLVSKDYVPISKMPAGKNGTELTAESTSLAKLKPIETDYSGTADISSSNPARKWLNSYLRSYSSTKTGWKATAYLVDTNVFSEFAESTVAKYAIGAPTLELFVQSYNTLNTDCPTEYKVASSGYTYTINLKSGSGAVGGKMDNIKSCQGLYNYSSTLYWAIAGGQYYGR